MVVWNLIELETPINGKPAHRLPLCWKEYKMKIFRASKNRGKNAQKLTQLVFFGSIQPVEEQCIETLIHER